MLGQVHAVYEDDANAFFVRGTLYTLCCIRVGLEGLLDWFS